MPDAISASGKAVALRMVIRHHTESVIANEASAWIPAAGRFGWPVIKVWRAGVSLIHYLGCPLCENPFDFLC